MSDLGWFLSCAGVAADTVGIVEALEAERDRYRAALKTISTRIPPSESNTEAAWRWATAYSALHRTALPRRYASLLPGSSSSDALKGEQG